MDKIETKSMDESESMECNKDTPCEFCSLFKRFTLKTKITKNNKRKRI